MRKEIIEFAEIPQNLLSVTHQFPEHLQKSLAYIYG